MSEFYGIIAGAVIALIGTIVTNYFTIKKVKLQEEKNSERLFEKLKVKTDLEIKTFEHNILINNREHIPNATRVTLVAINELFDCTEELVLNYPGTCYTGAQPSFIFNSTIDNLITGFPNSREELIQLSNKWYYSHKNFTNVVVENSMYLSGSILSDIWEFEHDCKNIRDYFYARYSGIESDEEFSSKKSEYQEQVDKYTFIQKDGVASPTHSVLNNYNIIKKSKSILVNKINNYQKQKTDF
ncbi:hypothetical protein [Candidatus Enterococcus lemimoniae]|uniref:Uncharacterized protein n=1 Tax=Candidatus Enterococcus lemimoniae TaxID=1834167 RepID=A0ABZ2T4H8_9ENTE